ncbi:MAG: hypothetical protein MK214_08440 [Thalassotalea sp.]|nr:hypothetical protein [Thalassotalea sp.]
MTTSQITDIASNLLSSTTAASSALGESTATNISQGFSIFSNLLSSAFSQSQDEAGSNTDFSSGQTSQLLGQENVVNTIQQQLFSSIGLDFANKEASASGSSILDGLTSDASISTMQGVLLQTLQTSLLSSTSISQQTTETAQASQAIGTTVASEETTNSIMSFAFGDDGMALIDGFDAVNVLQHIPIVSSIYQQATETDISAVSKLAGGFLYGGTTGLAFSVLDLAVEGFSGHSINDSILSFDYSGFAKQLFSGEEATSEEAAANAVASNSTSNGAQLFSLAKQVAQQTGG